jgi:hypothetical protein
LVQPANIKEQKMASVTHVKRAQQRYEMVPVIDPETGEQKVTVVTEYDGTPKLTKRGDRITMRHTVADKTKPLPNEICDKCGVEIKPGDGYKWIQPKSGPFGGRRMVRCATCPAWHRWEYSSSLDARIEELVYNACASKFDSVDDVEQILNDAAEAVRELASEKEESAQNIEDGFGHPTSASEELTEIASSLEAWADELEATDCPDYPEPEEGECEDCCGTGELEVAHCVACGGSGIFTPDEPTDDQVAVWQDEVIDAISAALDSPL